MKILDFQYIKNLNISAKQVYDWCNEAWKIKDEIIMPAKVKMWQGDSGRYITMPCVIPPIDIAGVKFISRNVDGYDLPPARNSNIMIMKSSEMGIYGLLDGIWITNMRTGAIAAHSVIEYSRKGFTTLGLMGLGIAARAFMLLLGSMYQREIHIKLLRYKNQAEMFIERFADEFPCFHFEIVDNIEEICSCDTVVSAVGYARSVFADESVFKPGCLIVPIATLGFQNCDLTFDKIIIDDHKHVASFKYYDQFKDKAVEISAIENGKAIGRENDSQRIIAYCGGLALHDIYIAAKVMEIVEEKDDVEEVVMNMPQERFWI